MNTIHELPATERIDAIVRRAGMERSLYIGEAIGNMLLIAGQAFEALGAWLRHAPAPRSRNPLY
jgi:hypothetical protein